MTSKEKKRDRLHTERYRTRLSKLARRKQYSIDSSEEPTTRKDSTSRTASPSNSNSVSSSVAESDKEGSIEIRPGELIHDRYKVLGVAGQGTFGTVLDVWDTKRREPLALKVIRSVKRYSEAAYVEIEILEKIHEADRNRDSRCVQLYSTFEIRYRGQKHVCMGFERLGRSLYEFIKRNQYRGFTLDLVRSFSYQLIKAVGFCHRMKLIHTDLKPENILFVNDGYILQTREKDKDYRVPCSSAIRLIDFGGATFDSDHHSKIVNTRQYRSPEVLLGLGWSFPSDMWSVGCILAELYTGELLFGTHEDLEHLALMQHILQKPLPESMTRTAVLPYLEEMKDREQRDNRFLFMLPDAGKERSPSTCEEEDNRRSSSVPRPDNLIRSTDFKLSWPERASKKSLKYVSRSKVLSEIIPDRDFLDLLCGLLEYNPAKRLTAEQALNHPFFKPLLREHPDGVITTSSSSSTSQSRSTSRSTSRSFSISASDSNFSCQSTAAHLSSSSLSSSSTLSASPLVSSLSSMTLVSRTLPSQLSSSSFASASSNSSSLASSTSISTVSSASSSSSLSLVSTSSQSLEKPRRRGHSSRSQSRSRARNHDRHLYDYDDRNNHRNDRYSSSHSRSASASASSCSRSRSSSHSRSPSSRSRSRHSRRRTYRRSNAYRESRKDNPSSYKTHMDRYRPRRSSLSRSRSRS